MFLPPSSCMLYNYRCSKVVLILFNIWQWSSKCFVLLLFMYAGSCHIFFLELLDWLLINQSFIILTYSASSIWVLVFLFLVFNFIFSIISSVYFTCQIITKATADGTLYTRNWDTEPLFPLTNADTMNKEYVSVCT